MPCEPSSDPSPSGQSYSRRWARLPLPASQSKASRSECRARKIGGTFPERLRSVRVQTELSHAHFYEPSSLTTMEGFDAAYGRQPKRVLATAHLSADLGLQQAPKPPTGDPHARELHGWLMTLFPATSSAQSLSWQSGFALALWVAVGVTPRTKATSPQTERKTPW